MPYKLSYYRAVKTDLAEAKDWYKKQQPGLEKRFASEVKNCINRLQKDPLHYEIKYRNVRTAFTSIFPYAIHFFLDEANKHQIIIIAVVHQRRLPVVSHVRDND